MSRYLLQILNKYTTIILFCQPLDVVDYVNCAALYCIMSTSSIELLTIKLGVIIDLDHSAIHRNDLSRKISRSRSQHISKFCNLSRLTVSACRNL